MFDSCEVFGIFLKLDVSDLEPLTAVRCFIYFPSFIFPKLDGSDFEPLSLCAMHCVLRLFAQPDIQSKKCFIEQVKVYRKAPFAGVFLALSLSCL